MQMSYRDADSVGDFGWIQRRLRQMSSDELLNPRKQLYGVADIFTEPGRVTDTGG